MRKLDLVNLMQLDERAMPSAVWPFAGAPKPDALLETYGQYHELVFQKRDTLIRLHEGIDIKADPQTQVFAVMDGFVDGVSKAGYNSLIVVRDKEGQGGWNYKHVIPSGALQKGSPVKAGVTVLGVVAPLPDKSPVPAHLHLDRGGSRDAVPSRAGLNWFAPRYNPLAEFADSLDATPPTVRNIAFRLQADDKLAKLPADINPGGGIDETPRTNARYFDDTTPVNGEAVRRVGRFAEAAAENGRSQSGRDANTDVDLIVDAYDNFGPTDNPGTNKLGVHRMSFAIEGETI